MTEWKGRINTVGESRVLGSMRGLWRKIKVEITRYSRGGKWFRGRKTNRKGRMDRDGEDKIEEGSR